MFLLHTVSMTNNIDIANAFKRYNDYLDNNQKIMPIEAYEFASAIWHYDPEDYRCPHDSWLENLNIIERSSGNRSEIRWVDISARLRGAYHNGWIDLYYTDVKDYSFKFANNISLSETGHGDWLIDEVRLSEKGGIIHEVVFNTGARWHIDCGNINHNWTELPSSPKRT